jgi:hypothetical protein
MQPGAKRFPRCYSAVLCTSLLEEASVLEEALGATSFSEEEALSLLEELEVSLFASELEAVSDLDSAFDSLAEVLWLSLVEALELSAWDELAASLVLEALEDELPDEALELELLDVLPEELPDWEPDSEVTPLPMETARLLLLTVEPL